MLNICRCLKILRYFGEMHALKNYLTMKTKIAFMLNFEIPITATATAEQPRLRHRWNLQEGGHGNFSFLKKSVCH